MKDNTQQLRQELRDAGAQGAEIHELMSIASRLGALKSPATSKARQETVPTRWQKMLRPAFIGATGLVAGALLVIVSESVPPTNMLFPVQNASDNVAVGLHPQYRATVMMKRALQVNELVAAQADSNKVLATLADYTQKASAYKSTDNADYAAFEYCKTKLEQAAATALPAVRQSILSSLQSLQNT